MKLASKKPALLQLPASLLHKLGNRQWLDCAMLWKRQGGLPLMAAPPGPMDGDFVRAGVQVSALRPPHSWLAGWQNKRLFGELFYRHAPEMIWLQDPALWPLLRGLTPRGAQLRCHLDQPLPATRLNKARLAGLLAGGCRLVVNSQFMRGWLEEHFALPATAVTLLPPAVDSTLFDPAQIKPDRALRLAADWRIPENSTLFLHYGPLYPDGGLTPLLQAFAQTGRRDLHLVLLGEEALPGYHDRLMAQISHFGLMGQVRVVESCSDMPAALWLAQAMVCPALQPGAADPALLAAQAMGRPLVVSNVASHMELVQPGSTAWIYPANSVSALQAALEEITTLGEQVRLNHGARVRQWVIEHFPYAPWCETMLRGALVQEQAA